MPKGTLYCALDITAGKIAGVTAAVKRTGEITDITCQSGPSAGIKNGRVNDVGLLSEAIADVFKKLNPPSRHTIKSLSVSIAGPQIKSAHSIGVIAISERSNKIITSGDIFKVNQQAYSLGLNMAEQLLLQVAQGYTIDNHNKAANPAGLYGHKLEVDLLLITAPNTDVENLISAVDRAGYRVRSIVLSAYATSQAVVPEADKRKGCVLLDIGFDTTQIAVFKDAVLRGFETFGRGSNHITEALARELKLNRDLAETVKISYGGALSHHIDPGLEVLIKKEQVYRPIKRREICLVIEKELKLLFDEIKKRLEVYQMTLELPAGIIVSGKIAVLEGFLESLEQSFNMPVRLAKIEGLASCEPAYATALGMIRYAASCAPNFNLLKLSSYGNIFQKIIHKSKEIYQEYF